MRVGSVVASLSLSLLLFGCALPSGAAALTGVNEVSAGVGFSCALLDGGTARCWGQNFAGQLGNSFYAQGGSIAVPVPVSGLVGATDISAGAQQHACAVEGTGGVVCWGDNFFGQLGNGTNIDSNHPVPVIGVADAVGISAFWFSTCALLDGGTIKCWGSGAGLGDGTGLDSSVPVDVVGIDDAVQVENACALLADGTVRCWGPNIHGQNGDGTTNASNVPVQVSGISNAVEISGIADTHCARLADGTVRCWGFGRQGQIGNGTTDDINPVPSAVSGIGDATRISVGSSHSCAIVTGGALKCWGDNGSGELGDGTTINASVPVDATHLTGIVGLSAGGGQTCALRPDTTLRCWGTNISGQLGDGTYIDSSVPRVVLAGFSSP